MVDARRSLLTLLDCLGIGALIVNHEGSVVDQNSNAEPYLRNEFRLVDHCLVLPDREANMALRATLAKAVREGEGKDLIVVPHARKAPSIIRSVPLPLGNSERGDVLLIIANLGRTMAPSIESLVQIFDLTRAEARLATRLAAGNTLGEIARTSNLSVGTVRIQLKSIFLKTRTHRQAELVSLLSRLARIAASTEK